MLCMIVLNVKGQDFVLTSNGFVDANTKDTVVVIPIDSMTQREIYDKALWHIQYSSTLRRVELLHEDSTMICFQAVLPGVTSKTDGNYQSSYSLEFEMIIEVEDGKIVMHAPEVIDIFHPVSFLRSSRSRSNHFFLNKEEIPRFMAKQENVYLFNQGEGVAVDHIENISMRMNEFLKELVTRYIRKEE